MAKKDAARFVTTSEKTPATRAARAATPDPYMECYISGRLDECDVDLDLEPLTDLIMSAGGMREACAAAAKLAVDKEMDPEIKSQWLADNADEITAMGGDKEKAYRLFVQGRVDGLAWSLEDEVVSGFDEDDDGGELDEDVDLDDPGSDRDDDEDGGDDL